MQNGLLLHVVGYIMSYLTAFKLKNGYGDFKLSLIGQGKEEGLL